MMKALSGALLLSLIHLSPTLAAAECPLRNAPGTEVVRVAGQCPSSAGPVARTQAQGQPLHSPWLSTGDDPVMAYAIQIAEGMNTVPRGLYRFGFPDFSSAQAVPGDEDLADDLADTYGMAFNPAASRLYLLQDLLASPALMRLNLKGPEPELEPVAFIDGFQMRMDTVTGMAIHPRTGEGWLVSYRQQTNNPPITEAWLWRLDTQTGATQFAGRLLAEDSNPVLVDLAIDCDGNMYAHNISDDSLYHIDTRDLAVTRIGSHGLPANYNQGLAFDNRDNTLYGWIYTGDGDNQFGTFNLANGAFDALVQNDPRGQWNGAIPTRCPALAVPDPSAFQGAWYDPVSNGQGLALNWMADSETVFIPWFTFAPAVADEDEEGDEEEPDLNSLLRWHVLQGQWSPGQSEVTMPIYEVSNGRFDDGVAVDQREVGEATLSFAACDVGVLDYSFHSGENAGLAGAINLTRLLPRSGPCREAAGHVVPAGGDYDPLMTGAWYDPASEGQGLSLFRVAPDPEEEADIGMFYGAWFTFDPEPLPPGEDDDEEDDLGPVPEGPAGQQWFTFGGQEVDEEGVVTVPLHLTIGGTFDGAAAFVPRVAGEATLTSTACDRLTLTYEFADTVAMGRFRGLEGEINLVRLGACP